MNTPARLLSHRAAIWKAALISLLLVLAAPSSDASDTYCSIDMATNSSICTPPNSPSVCPVGPVWVWCVCQHCGCHHPVSAPPLCHRCALHMRSAVLSLPTRVHEHIHLPLMRRCQLDIRGRPPTHPPHSPARRCKSANVASNSPECVRCGRASDRTSVPPIPGLPLGLACGDECASSAHLPSNIPVHALMHWCMAGRMPKANQVGTPQATDQCSRASCRPCACLCASLCCTPPQHRGRTCMHVDPAAPTTSFLSLPPMRDVVLPAQHWYCTTVTCASTQHLY